MAVKQTGRKQYKTTQGVSIDMDLLQRNELTPQFAMCVLTPVVTNLVPVEKLLKNVKMFP